MAYLEHFRDRNLEDLSPKEIGEIDEELDRHLALHGLKAFSEASIGRVARGVPGLFTSRQTQRNQQAIEASKFQSQSEELK